MGNEKPGNVLTSILDKKAALKDADAETNVGVRKQAVEKKREADNPKAADPDAPTKYNTPRKPGESFDDFMKRLDDLTTKHKSAESTMPMKSKGMPGMSGMKGM